eukprot:353169-Chlamydomonas_euryale.AAC.1
MASSYCASASSYRSRERYTAARLLMSLTTSACCEDALPCSIASFTMDSASSSIWAARHTKSRQRRRQLLLARRLWGSEAHRAQVAAVAAAFGQVEAKAFEK